MMSACKFALPAGLSLALLTLWAMGAAAGLPEDDSYEPNDLPPFAFDLRGHEGAWLSDLSGPGVQYEDDWYLVSVARGRHQLNLDLQGLSASSAESLRLDVLDPRGVMLTSIWWSASAAESVALDVLTPGICHVGVGGSDGGLSYDLRWNSPPDDRYEPNNTLRGAFDLSDRPWCSQAYDEGAMVQADDDWYRIRAETGFLRILAECRFRHAEGDIDLALVDASGTVLAASRSMTDNEEIDYTVARPGTYYLRVFYGNSGNRYQICWQALAGDPGGDDAYEPNDTLAGGYDLTAVEGQWLSSALGAAATWRDKDWYTVEAGPGDHTVGVDWDVQTAGLWQGFVSVIDDAGQWVGGDNRFHGQGLFQLRFAVPRPGRYYILIDATTFPVGTPFTYDLRWHADADDAYEENDTLATAFSGQWGPGPFSTLHRFRGFGYQWDDDWYIVHAAPDYNLTIDCLFEHAQGDIDIALYDTNMTFLAQSASVDDNEHIEYAFGGTETTPHLLRVHYGNAGNRYNLTYNTWQVPHPIPGDDSYEPNNTLATAYDLSLTRGMWLGDAAGLGNHLDNDWYRIDLPAGTAWVVVETLGVESWGPRPILYDRWGRPVSWSAETVPPQNRRLAARLWALADPGPYFILVYTSPPAGPYNLRWNVFPATVTPASSGPYEYNDSMAWACDLTACKRQWLSAIGGPAVRQGEDWYAVYAGTGQERLIVECRFDRSAGGILFVLVDRSGARLAVSEDLGDVQRLDVIVPSAGLYYLWICNGGQGQEYDLRWNAVAPFGPACRPPRIAFYDDPGFVDMGGGGGSWNGAASLKSLLDDPDVADLWTFTGTSDAAFAEALEEAEILCIPALYNGDLSAALSGGAMEAVRTFVSGGGGLMVVGDYYGRSARLVNDLFGFGVSAGPDIWAGEYGLLPGARDTAWEFGPPAVDQNYDELVWETESLPDDASAIYGFGDGATDYAAVAHLPVGPGRIAFLVWSFRNSVPRGYDDGGWTELLRNALEQLRPCAPPELRIDEVLRHGAPEGTVIVYQTQPRLRYRVEYGPDPSRDSPEWRPFADASPGVGTWIDTTGFSHVRGFLDDFGPATTGGQPAGGRRFYRIAAEVPEDLALFGDPFFTDPDYVELLSAGLERLRHVVRVFHGVDPDAWSAALADVHAVVVPSLVIGDLAASLPAETLDVLGDAIVNGATLVLTGDPNGHAAALVDDLLGSSLVRYGWVSGYPMGLVPDAGLPEFEGAPTELPGNLFLHPWDTANVGAIGTSVYEDPYGLTAVAWIALGAGRIVFLAWDWSDARPMGGQDGGWMEILKRITRP